MEMNQINWKVRDVGNYWIGIEKNDESNTQVWMDGTAVSLDSYLYINDDGTCFKIFNNKWQDEDCSNANFGYICERTIIGT